MEQKQQLGGTRHGIPLDDEMIYPLTSDEFQLINENLLVDKLTNWESFLLTTGITMLISGIILCLTGSFQINGQSGEELNIKQIIIVVIYFAISIGTFLGFIVLMLSKKKSKNAVARLKKKIANHLNFQGDE